MLTEISQGKYSIVFVVSPIRRIRAVFTDKEVTYRVKLIYEPRDFSDEEGASPSRHELKELQRELKEEFGEDKANIFFCSLMSELLDRVYNLEREKELGKRNSRSLA